MYWSLVLTVLKVKFDCTEIFNPHLIFVFLKVEKILDVILSSPGTRIGQASECFVYWKDDRRNDTWGLNFTSPIDAKQFRECCDFSKSSARYLYKNGLRLGSKVCFIYKSYLQNYSRLKNI